MWIVVTKAKIRNLRVQRRPILTVVRGCDEHFSPFFSLLMNERNKLPLYHHINVLIYALLVKIVSFIFLLSSYSNWYGTKEKGWESRKGCAWRGGGRRRSDAVTSKLSEILQVKIYIIVCFFLSEKIIIYYNFQILFHVESSDCM